MRTFRELVQEGRRTLAAAGVTAHQITVATIVLSVATGALVSNGTTIAFDTCLVFEITSLEEFNGLFRRGIALDTKPSLGNAIICGVGALYARETLRPAASLRYARGCDRMGA